MIAVYCSLAMLRETTTRFIMICSSSCLKPRLPGHQADWSIDVGQPMREHVSKAAVAALGGDPGRAALS